MVPDGGNSPEGLLESKQSVDVLLAALDRVPLPRRAVVVMHDLEGVPIAEVAKLVAPVVGTGFSSDVRRLAP